MIQSPEILEPQLARHPASLAPTSGDDHLANDEFQVGAAQLSILNRNCLNLTPSGSPAKPASKPGAKGPAGMEGWKWAFKGTRGEGKACPMWGASLLNAQKWAQNGHSHKKIAQGSDLPAMTAKKSAKGAEMPSLFSLGDRALDPVATALSFVLALTRRTAFARSIGTRLHSVAVTRERDPRYTRRPGAASRTGSGRSAFVEAKDWGALAH